MSVYVSDFGNINIIPSRLIKSDMALLLDPSDIKIRYLRNLHTEDLPKTGDSIKKVMRVEWGLELKNEKAHASWRGIKAA